MEDRYEKELLKTQLEVQEQTLADISRDIHDDIGSSISIARAYLNSAAPAEEKIKNTSEMLKDVLTKVRDMSKSLSIETIRTDGLSKAIEGLVTQVKKIGHYQVTYETIGNYNLLDEKIEIITFRILQESINNIIRHAEATAIAVTLNCCSDEICLSVQDDGCGLDPTLPSKPGGLSNMRVRAA